MQARLQEIKDRADKATKAPWVINKTDDAGWCECPLCQGEGEVLIEDISADGWDCMVQSCGIGEMVNDNTDFIANARQDVPFLLDVIEGLQRQLRISNGIVDKYQKEIIPGFRERAEQAGK